MRVPGSNLLNIALRAISKQKVGYYKFSGRDLNSIGQYEDTYDDPINIYGSFQAVSRKMYAQYDLDFSKYYATFYTSNDILATDRDVTGDKISYNNYTWKCESNNDWFAQDGWKGVLVVRIIAPS